jgi:superfamily I DNA/RNA helicase
MFASQVAWDEGLDEAQLAVATHGETPLVVVAGAGTGKTRALTSRVACLLDRGVAPDRILLLTFTRRAADEMLARARDLVGLRGGERPQGGTFHAVAHRHVASYAEVLNLPPGFGVLDPSLIVDGVLGALGMSKGSYLDRYAEDLVANGRIEEVIPAPVLEALRGGS